ncbi:hypothetical protein D9M73_276400 [compost metagenome]
MLGNGERRPRRLPPHQRRRIGGRDDDDTARQTFRAEIVLDEFLHFATALADQPDHRDVAFGPACQHREQHRFPDARAGEQAKALPLT